MQFDEKKISDFIEMANLGFHTKNDVLEMLDQVQNIFDDINQEVANVECCLQQIDLHEEKVSEETLMSYGVSWKEYEELDNKRSIREQVARYVEELEKIRDTFKNFDKSVCFANIRNLLKNTDVKIGQIEREAGVRLGYMSRLEKPDNTSEPSVEFIVSAAKMLNVSVDSLVRGSFEVATINLDFLTSFIKKLIQDTEVGRIEWRILRKIDISLIEMGMHSNPLYRRLSKDGENKTQGYSSSYYGGPILADDDFFVANVPKVGEVYITAVIKNHKDEIAKRFYEMYITKGQKSEPIPICCTLENDERILPIVLDLYNCIKRHDADIHINEVAKGLMMEYLYESDLVE